jgi:hypothetical protein
MSTGWGNEFDHRDAARGAGPGHRSALAADSQKQGLRGVTVKTGSAASNYLPSSCRALHHVETKTCIAMSNLSPPHPDQLKVFISSTYVNNKSLRSKLATHLAREGHHVSIAETTQDQPGFIDLNQIDRSDIIEISDLCLSELAKSDIIIAILTGGLGSRLRINDELFRAKHFELEIFSGLMQGKPILLCSLPNFEADYDTRSLVDSLIEGRKIYRFQNEEDLIYSALRYCAEIGNIRNKGRVDESVKLTKALSIIRASYRTVKSHNFFLPLFGTTSLEPTAPNIEYAEDALNHAENQENLHLRLSRLWAALKELLPSQPSRINDPRVSALWERLLTSWTYASSWYGLHAHIYLGSVAAATSLWTLRLNEHRNDASSAPGKQLPVGQLVSANYSLIQRIPYPIRYFAFWSLLRFLDKNRDPSRGNSNILLLRGSINFRLFRPLSSINDFRSALQIVERNNAAPAAVGDVKIHLALPLALVGRRREARAMVDDGISQIRDRVGSGELLRALRKAIQIEKLPLGDPERAAEFRRQADEIIAKAGGQLDQSRHFRNP